MALVIPRPNLAGQISLLLLEALFVLPFIYYARLLPYTKVEESFNMQAVHDISKYGVFPEEGVDDLKRDYDHFEFPGVVPRTFTGALLLSTAHNLWGALKVAAGLPHEVEGLQAQIETREILGAFNAFFLYLVSRRVKKAFGTQSQVWFMLLLVSQFHITSYASRTLPNIFALGPVSYALSGFLPIPVSTSSRRRLSLYILTLFAVVFRAEIAALLVTHIAYHYARGRLHFSREILPALVAGGALALAITVSIDSYFWQKWTWPEFEGFYFNAIQGKSVEWGTSPWHFYFSNALPRLLLNPLAFTALIPLALAMPGTRRQSIDILIPTSAFVGLYSFMPHKEWRFIVYVVPAFTTVAAMGANYIWVRRSRGFLYRMASLGLLGSFGITLSFHFLLTLASSLNYPGGVALQSLHQMVDGKQHIIRVHMDDLAVTTGVTRFLQVSEPQTQSAWAYDKTEDTEQLLSPVFWESFDYVLTERPEKTIGAFQTVGTIDGFGGAQAVKPMQISRTRPDQSWDRRLVNAWNRAGLHLGLEYGIPIWPQLSLVPKIHILQRDRRQTSDFPGKVGNVVDAHV